jgi:Protein of unknown function (DUF3293).
VSDHPRPLNEAWSSYPETVLVFAGEPEMMIDLREPVPPATKNALKAMGLGGPFSVLTSYNPRGETIDAAENDRRFKELTAELESEGIEYLVMDACSPDRSHCECSVVLKGDRKVAIDIAKRWEQVAIFWYDGGKFWIYGGIFDVEPIPLPVS